MKNLLEIKDKRIKDLEAENKRQKERMESMSKEHQAAVKALEKLVSHKVTLLTPLE